MRPTTRRWLYLVIGAALLALSSRWVEPLNAMRTEHQLVAAPIEQIAAPDKALPILMAVGRAPLVDYLWIRATKLKEQGRYFDALQLSELICALQPRFASVWAFNAWNMAYNISVTCESAEERWRWVKNGLSLLRDRGIPANPHNTQLYREMAWIYFHKVADFMDEKHWYYKSQFALMMEDILGPGGECDWEALAAAPAEWSALAGDSEVQSLVAECRQWGHDITRDGVLLGLLNQKMEAEQFERAPDEPPPVWSVLDDPQRRSAIKKVEYYWRSKRLREEMKLDPKRVLELRKEFGPIDFRLGEAHALYWADMGMNLGSEKAVRLDPDKLNTNRIMLYSLQTMYRRGRLIMSPDARLGAPPMLMPDMRFFPALFELALKESARWQRNDPDKSDPIADDFESGFLNFMRDAVVRYYESGDEANARHYFDWLREHYPHADFERGLEPFVFRTIMGELQVLTVAQAMGQINSHIDRALRFFAYSRDRDGLTALTTARWVHTQYNKDAARRANMPPFDEMVKERTSVAREFLPPEAHARLEARLNRARASATRPANP